MSNFQIVGNGTALEETVASFLCGMLFGATSVIVGHPLDTIKTKLQADPGFRNANTFGAMSKLMHEGGIRAFYTGMLPPLLGSTFFRSIQFASYSATVTLLKDEDHPLRRVKLGGVEARVFVGGAVAGATRALLESPLDLLKTRKQTDPIITFRDVPIRDLYKGFSATLARNVMLLGVFFVFIDRLSYMDTFARGGIATTAAWTSVWPLDVAKSRMQCAAAASQPRSLMECLSEAARDGTLYRGYSAGITRSFVANGAALQAYQFGQNLRTQYFSRRGYN